MKLEKKIKFAVQLKKVFTIFIAFLYLVVSSGFALEIHHCMGKVADVSLLPSAVDRCGNCGMKKGANECCKDELKLVKLQDAHKLISTDYQLHMPVAAIIRHLLTDQYYVKRLVSTKNNSIHSPPESSPVSLCIINCVYRI